MRNERLDRVLVAYSPDKTMREIANEVGEERAYVQKALCARGLKTKRDLSRRGRPRKEDWPTSGATARDECRLLREWPTDMRFVDAVGVR
jgi:hypothetical protein